MLGEKEDKVCLEEKRKRERESRKEAQPSEVPDKEEEGSVTGTEGV